MNNFQRLAEEQERKYDAHKRQHVQHNLEQTFGVFKFIGQIVDVYLPAMVGVLISAVGGNTSGGDGPGPNPPPSDGGGHPGGIGPHPPDKGIHRR